MTDNNENQDKVKFLKAGEKQAIKDVLEAIEDKLYERGKLVTLTGDSESEVSIVYEWTGCDDHPDDEEGPYLIIRINAENPKETEIAEEICDYVNEKVNELLEGLDSSEDVEVLKDLIGEQVILNGRLIY
mgnify:CR=1 FL=1